MSLSLDPSAQLAWAGERADSSKYRWLDRMNLTVNSSTATNLMALPSILVCEQRDRWSLAWRRALGAAGVKLRSARSLHQCATELADSPCSLVAIEITPENAASLLSAITRWRRRYPDVRIIGMIGETAGCWEPMVREAGAVLVIHSALDVPAAAQLALRHLSKAPRERLSLRGAILKRLPWSEFATPGFHPTGMTAGDAVAASNVPPSLSAER
jgi:PleD family two-component response regulator